MTARLACPLDAARGLLRRACGVELGPAREKVVRDRLAALAAREGGATFEALVGRAVADPGGAVARQVVEALLNHDTRFFRDRRAFAFFADHLPAPAGEPFRVWSAGCSTGQEAYSLALAVRERAPDLWPRLELVASDASTAALARARAGTFTRSEVNRGLPARLLVKWFTECGRRWRIDPALRGRMRFEQLDLTGPWPARPAFDAVFCCHVLVWLEERRRAPLLDRLAGALRPGGRLFLGASEPVLRLPRGLVREPAAPAQILRRPADGGAA